MYFEIPAAANVQEPQLLVKQAGGDNVIISEVVIYEGKLSADCLNIPQKVEIPEADFEECTFNLYASDVVGKRVDANPVILPRTTDSIWTSLQGIRYTRLKSMHRHYGLYNK